jgi:hypothetical protein
MKIHFAIDIYIGRKLSAQNNKTRTQITGRKDWSKAGFELCYFLIPGRVNYKNFRQRLCYFLTQWHRMQISVVLTSEKRINCTYNFSDLQNYHT